MKFFNFNGRPKGSEVSITDLIKFFQRGYVIQFYYQRKGYWITAEVNSEGLKNKIFHKSLEKFKSDYKTDSLNEYRVYAKVISKEEFEMKFKDTTGKYPSVVDLNE